jgi:hypothetical protein
VSADTFIGERPTLGACSAVLFRDALPEVRAEDVSVGDGDAVRGEPVVRRLAI